MKLSWRDFPLRQVVASAMADAGGQGWLLREDGRWSYLNPPQHAMRVQGWKLHVSATVLSAPLVLYQAARVLVGHGCAFKYAANLTSVSQLTSKHTDRAQVGKFITVYPRDDDHLRTLAPLLDRATAGLPGPQVPSDRPYREGSLVSYRYGAFAGVPVLTNEGSFEAWLEAPDGTLVEDVRQPWFCPPAWTQPPYPGPAAQASRPPAEPRPVLLNDRFRVESAIRHSARGGVYRGVDLESGQRVVIKQARAHISGLTLGDARDGLRHESQMLALLAGLAPAEVLLFAQGQDLYLVLEELVGHPLSAWVYQQWQPPSGRDGEEGPPVAEAIAVAGRLAEVVAAVHARGLVIRDLSPSNVMVLTDGTVKLVDAELVIRPGVWAVKAHTPGFAAPEVLAGPSVGPAPGPAADLYSLGVVLLQLVAGTAPPPVPAAADLTAGTSPTATVARLVRYAGIRNPAVRRLAAAIRGLTAADPDRRWSVARLREHLAGPPEVNSRGNRSPAGLDPDRQQRLLEDGLAYLVAAVSARTASDRIVSNGEFGSRSDPCNVQHGAAGVLEVLVRASEQYGTEQLRDAVVGVARWVDRRRIAVPKLLPGLYFGRAGTAWALYSAGQHLGDAGMAERALELAAALPVRWPNPDLTHGTAGVGLASLHLWSQAKEPSLLDRVVTAADYLREQVRLTDQGHVYWQVPPDADSRLARVAHLGFAHGVAGIGAFLLAAATTGQEDVRELAVRAGETLAASAVRQAGAAYWPNAVTGPDPADLRYFWCSGASGVGTFLVRLWQATGEDRWRQLAHEAAVMVHQGRWVCGISTCHGLAGNGDFLLDLDQASGGDGPYRGWAEELAAVLYSRHTSRDGRVVVGDEAADLNLDYGTGLAGVVGFALRLRYGGPRWWMAEAALGRGDAGGAAAD